MSHISSLRIIEYQRQYAAATVTMWRKSKEKAIGKKEAHSFDDHVAFLNATLAIDKNVYLAIADDEDEVLGLIATNGK